MSLIPGIGGLFCLGIDSGGILKMFKLGSSSPLSLGLIGKFPDWGSTKPVNTRGDTPEAAKFPPGIFEEVGMDRLLLDKRIVFAPSEGFILFIPKEGNTLIRHPFDFKGFLDSTGKDYFFVKNQARLRADAGDTWKYAMALIARDEPVSFKLETGPEGMTLSPEGMLD